MAVDRLDACAHHPERFHDAPHRAAGQRLVADHHRREWLGRKNSGKHAHRGAGVSGVEWRRRRTELAQASSFYSDDVSAPADLDAEAAKTRERRLAVRAWSIIAQFGASVRECGQQRVAV